MTSYRIQVNFDYFVPFCLAIKMNSLVAVFLLVLSTSLCSGEFLCSWMGLQFILYFIRWEESSHSLVLCSVPNCKLFWRRNFCGKNQIMFQPKFRLNEVFTYHTNCSQNFAIFSLTLSLHAIPAYIPPLIFRHSD